MGNFVKFCVGFGLISLLSLVFVLFVHDRDKAERTVQKAVFKKDQTEFDKRFYDSWNRSKMEMADSQGEKQYWKDQTEKDQVFFEEREEQAQTEITEAKEILEGRKDTEDAFIQAVKETTQNPSFGITDKEFEKALKEVRE
jgi:basic membrane lipoprotein Med (substrate-binding protein (PBP1-ABC) superfamily)